MKKNTSRLLYKGKEEIRCKLILLSILTVLFSYSDVFTQVNWTKYPNPVVRVGGPEKWDNKYAFSPSVVFKDSTYHLWYYGAGNDTLEDGFGYTTSTDGINWTKYENNPVFVGGDEGSWDYGGLDVMSVIFVDSVFKMWYDASKTVEDRNQLRLDIGYAHSKDGINWTKYADNPVLRRGTSSEWDSLFVTPGGVIYDGATYHMWFMGARTFPDDISFGYASSPDGINWTKHDQNPIMEPNSDSWDKMITNPNVLYHDGYYHMWYHGMQPSRIGYAYSEDGILWTKYENNPIFKGEADKWDLGINYSNVLYDSTENIFKMWYSGVTVSPSFLMQIGYATAPNDRIFVTIPAVQTVSPPINYNLFQNYPNPFNPETEISFKIPKKERVIISIFNTIGQEIIKLTDQEYDFGRHSAVWDGKNFSGNQMPSGIYFYKITVGKFEQTKKMTLLR